MARRRRPLIRRLGDAWAAFAGNTARATRPSYGEQGYGGVPVFAGLLSEAEWNPELIGISGLQTLKKMVETDPTMQAAHLALTLPLTAATWKVEPYSDNERDRAVADLVEAQLMHMVGLPWADFVDECMDVLTFGHYAWEKIWTIDTMRGQQVVRLHRMSARPPESVTYVHATPNGDFDGLTQFLMGDAGGGEVRIPAAKLLFLCRKPRGNNLRGRSMYRAAYKPWFIKKELELIASIGFERRSMGVDVGTLSADEAVGKVTADRKAAAELMLMSLGSREQQFALEVPGFKYRLEGLQGGTLDPTSFIEYLDTLILRATLTTFIKEAGGLAADNATKARGSFFVKALRAHGAMLAGAITDQVIGDIVRFNYPALPRDEYPRLVHGPVETADVTQLASAIGTLSSARVLTDPTGEVENAVRQILSLPERDLVQQPVGGQPPTPATPDALAARAPRKRTKGPARHPVEAHVDFAGMNDAMDAATEMIVAKVAEVQVRQADALVRFARDQWKRGTLGSALDVEVPYTDEVARAIEGVLLTLVNRGREEVGREMGLQGMAARFAVRPPDPERASQVAAFIRLRAQAMARIMRDKLLSSYTFGMLGQARQGDFNPAALAAALKELSDHEVRKAANLSVAEALQFGRRAEQAALEGDDLVDHYVYSALGDANTCGPCNAVDGTVVQPGSAEFEALYPPLRNGPSGACEGRDQCRCDMIAVYKGQATPGS